jgi:hypothetical protein
VVHKRMDCRAALAMTGMASSRGREWRHDGNGATRNDGHGVIARHEAIHSGPQTHGLPRCARNDGVVHKRMDCRALLAMTSWVPRMR